jgi:hypothetical protein
MTSAIGGPGGHVSQHSQVNSTSQLNSSVNPAASSKRRSTRIERSIPLIVLGQNQAGEPFMERTASVTLSKHGCRYPSRFDYGVGTSVTLQLMGSISGNEKAQTVRAIVRSIHPPASLRELQQVGVELEIPANVWGIAPAPADWSAEINSNVSKPQLPTVAASSTEPETKIAGLGKVVPQIPDPRVQEVASLPSQSPPVAAVPQVPTTQPKRVVVTPDGLISALQGKLEHEAEKAVQAALAKQMNDAIQEALRSIDGARESSMREVERLIPTQIDEVKRSLKEEFAAQLAAQRKAEIEAYRKQTEEITRRLETQAGELRRELANAAQEYEEKMTREIGTQVPLRLTEAVRQATSDFESETGAAIDRRRQQLLDNMQAAAQEALLNLNARSAEFLAQSQNALNSGLEEFQRETDRHAQMVLAETQERAVSALGLLEAESRSACDARRQALDADVARSGELAVDEFRKGMKAFLYSCLVAAVDAVDEHSKTTLNELKTNEALRRKPVAACENEIVPNADSDLLTH